MTLRSFSDEDINTLSEMATEYRQRRGGNRPITPEAGKGYNEGEVNSTPELYIALPRTAVDALVRQAPGTTESESGDRPGHAIADIYRIIDDSVSEAFLEPISKEEKIFNLSQQQLAKDWMLVSRTKFGKYVVIAGSAVCP